MPHTLRLLRDQLNKLTDDELDREAISMWGMGQFYGARLMYADWLQGHYIQLWDDYKGD